MTTFSYTQLEQIWTENGGSAIWAPIAAAVAMEESGGNSNATNVNTNGSVDRGLWQINSVHGPLSTTDINGNARAAIQISNNGTNWKPWCTTYSDNACGAKGGTFLGPGSRVLQFLQGTATTPVGNSVASNQAATVASSSSTCLAPLHIPGCNLLPGVNFCACLWYQSWSRGFLGGIFMLGAGWLLIAGTILLAAKTPIGKAAVRTGKRIGTDALIAGVIAA